MQLIFERGLALRTEKLQLAANFYNKLHTIFARKQDKNLFISIRNLQYLAVIDEEEVIFVDGLKPRYVLISWQSFKPHLRNNLSDPVAYDCIYYVEAEPMHQQRLLSEFFKAIGQVEARLQEIEAPAGVVKPFKAD